MKSLEQFGNKRRKKVAKVPEVAALLERYGVDA